MMVVQHNLASMFTQRELKTITGQKSKSTEKLSSGYKINRSADDAAGLAISEKMRWQIRGLDRASQNIQDGISYVQTGEGALNEVHSMLQRIRELSVQAANDTNTKTDRENLDAEVQEIKEEIEQIFNDTEFNTKKIFRAPYIPTIKNEPQDFAMFNVGAGGSETGGVLINNKRYTWEELGVDKTWNTPSHEDREFVFYDDVTDKWGDNATEKITLLLKAGETLPNVHRVYEMDADNEGILINGIYAGKWDDGTIQQNGLEYSFSHHGCDFSFTAEEGATRESIIKHLQPDDISRLTWEAVPSGKDSWNAVHSTADQTMTLNVTESNKASKIPNNTSSEIERWKYSIVADQEGVGIVQQNYLISDGITHTKTEWEDFKNTDTGEEEYPIVDYGTDSSDIYNAYDPVIEKSTSVNPITLDDEATYHYSDVKNNAKQPEYIEFDFSFLRDEVGKAEAINGLNQELSSTGVIAPIKEILLDNSNMDVVDYAGLNFHFQRDQLLRDFGENGSDAPMSIRIERTKVGDGSVTSFQNRAILSEAYVGWRTKTRTKEHTETGTVLVTEDREGNKSYSSFEIESSQDPVYSDWGNVVIQVGDEDKLIGDIPTSKSNATKQTGDPEYGELGEQIGEETFYQDGSKSYRAIISRTVKEEETTYLERNALYYKKDGQFKYASDQTAYTYLSDYDPEALNLLRDNNCAPYHKAASADGAIQRYVSIGTEAKEDKTYHLNHYEYVIKNKDGDVIMTGKSASFIDTGENPPEDPNYSLNDIIDSDADKAYDEAHGKQRADVQRSENQKNAITLLTGYYDEEGRFCGSNGTYATDQAVRDITFIGENDDHVAAMIKIQYDDTGDTTGEANKKYGGNVKPDGMAHRDFYKSERTAGAAIETNFKIKMNPPEKLLHIQSGAKGWQSIDIKYPALTNAIIGIGSSGVKTWGQASSAISEMDGAIEMISKVRTTFGVYHNRLEYAYAIDQNTSENTQAAESRIRDTDMAKEMVSYSKSNILSQAAQAMLSQTNQQPQGILALLQ